MLEAPRFREGFGRGDRRPRPHRAPARARTPPGASTARRCAPAHDAGARRSTCPTSFTTRRESAHLPGARAPQLLPARPRAAPRRRARRCCEDLLDALALGIGDYFEKTRAFKTIGVALSGGRDSLLTLLIAHRYAQRARPDDAGRVCCSAFYMPTRYSSAETRDGRGRRSARELGVPSRSCRIDEAFERELEAAKAMLGRARR